MHQPIWGHGPRTAVTKVSYQLESEDDFVTLMASGWGTI